MNPKHRDFIGGVSTISNILILHESNKEKQKKVQEDKKMLKKNQSNIEDENIS